VVPKGDQKNTPNQNPDQKTPDTAPNSQPPQK
jgi:hypothetical protein